MRSRQETTTLARRFRPPEFAISQLPAAYEAVWGTQLDAANLQCKVWRIAGLVAPLESGGGQTGRRRRPMYFNTLFQAPPSK